ncbi:MAG TPA: hypothetical protein VMZ71_08175 [Gemmataceae bacterium]|nr:hypothetical protein [Gemmataceae bacterium]
MNVGMLTLLGPLAVGGPTSPVTPAPTTPAAMVRPGGVAPMPGHGAGPVMPFPNPGFGAPVPAPLLAARVLAPAGVRVTAFPGSDLSRMFDGPQVFGLRPGYIYRLELSNLPYYPGKVLYPEVEVQASIVPRPGMKYMDYPIPLLFTQGDIDRALAGAVVTKVVYLEDPEKAIPAEIPANTPIEIPVGSEAEGVKAARESGRVVAIVRLGDRKPPAEWLTAAAVDGTILLPGEKYLKAPVAPPVFRSIACPLYDPILGPKMPNEECFVDGGDKKAPLGIGPTGKPGGLDATDVGVEYTIGGRRRITTSNIVCICSPRFVIQRSEIAPGGYNASVVIAGNIGAFGPNALRDRIAPRVDIGREKPTELDTRLRTSAYIGKVGVGFYIGTQRPVVHAQVEGVKIEAAVVEPHVLTGPYCPFTVTKSVDSTGPVMPGDIVTFTITYKNTGVQAISDVVVNDSLSGRLEYVAGTQQTDRPANFSATANEVGSTIVKWELPGVLLPGQSGTVKFKAKVR